MADIRLGVVGAGLIAKFHFPAFAETRTPVVIIADLDRDRAQPCLDRFEAEYADNYEAVVTHPQVDAVVVFGPTPLHYPVTRAALENGKHVICEKTFTLAGSTSLELAQLAQAKDLLLYCSYMKRFFPAVRKVKELLPQLGLITSVYCRTYQGFGGTDCYTGEIPSAQVPGPDGQSPIRKMAGGGVLICGGSHIYDLLLHLIGKPTRVYARQFRRDESDVDINTHALMDLADGGTVHFEGNWHPLRRIGYENRGWDEGFEISGVGGRIILQTPVWCEPEHNAPVLKFYNNRTLEWTEYTFDIVNPFVAAERYFLGQIEKGEQGEYDRFVGYRADYLLEMTQKSVDENQPVELVWDA